MFKWVRSMKSENWAGVAGEISNLIVLTSGVAFGDTKSVIATSIGFVSDAVFWKRGETPGGYSLGCVLGAATLGILSSSDAVGANKSLEYLMLMQAGVWASGGLRYPVERAAEHVYLTHPQLAKGLDKASNSIKVGVSTGSMMLRPLLILASTTGANGTILAAQLFAATGDFLRGKIRKKPPHIIFVPAGPDRPKADSGSRDMDQLKAA